MQRKTKQRQLYLLYFVVVVLFTQFTHLYYLRSRDSEQVERERVGRWNTRANPKSSMDEHQDNIQ